MKIIRAESIGMCFGVRDAIAIAKQKVTTAPLTILGELVHNETVLADLRHQGVQFEKEVANVTTPTVMITAHGTSNRRLQEVRALGFHVVEGTCPLVHFAHRSLRKLVEAGYYPIVIGQRDHVEVRGMTDDLAEFEVVLSQDDISRIKERPQFGVISQTTQPVDKVRSLVWLLQMQFPQSEVRFVDTVCQPTKQRQTAALDLAQQSDVVVVIGGANSNNTKELVSTCARHCARVHHVQNADELKLEWFAGAEVVGLTAGTSTPDNIIYEVETQLQRLTAPLTAKMEIAL